jgi:peptidoglycan hydrolase CwlO-like protein
MDTKLFAVFILSAALGAIIVITGCIKILGKTGELNMKTAGFILAGFIFVALPVLGTISIEWGEFKLLINTTNKQVQLEQTLDSLKTANSALNKDIDSLQSNFSSYKQAGIGFHAEPVERVELARQIEKQFDNIRSTISTVRSSLDTASSKSTQLKKDLRKFEERRWYIKPVD